MRKKNFKLIFFFLAFFIIAGLIFIPLGAFAEGDYKLSITQINSQNFPNIEAYVSFVDNAGETIKGLSKNDFSVLEDSTQIKDFMVNPLRDSKQAVSFALAIDCSYSMKDSGALPEAKNGASKFVEMMDGNDQCTVISFSRNITNKVDELTNGTTFTSDKNVLYNAINSINPEPFTKLYDGIYEAIRTVSSTDSFRKCVIVLTDAIGTDEKSTRTIDDCINYAKGLGIPVYAIGEGSDVNEELLKKIASETGGLYFFASDPQNLLKLYQKISKNIHNEYTITYSSKISEREAPKTHSLTVKVFYNNQEFTAIKEFVPVIVPSKYPVAGIIIIAVLAILLIILAIIFAWRKNKKQCPSCKRLIDKNVETCPYCGYSFVIKPEPLKPPKTVVEEVEEVEDKTRIVKKGFATAWLTVIEGKDKGRTFDVINERVTSIGRDSVNDVVLDDGTVSRKHAKVSFKNSKYFIHDLASSNGTFVNEKKIDVSEIKDGDLIYIGDVTLTFKTIQKKEEKEK